jgi:DNA-binding NarL/FixJ family response regulator
VCDADRQDRSAPDGVPPYASNTAGASSERGAPLTLLPAPCPDETRLSVGILTTQEVVAIGLRTILESAAIPFAVTTGQQLEIGEPDVVLYDVIKLHREDGADLDYWLKESKSTVIAIDRTLKPELAAQARERGVEWMITLAISPKDLVAVIQEAVSGHLEDSTIADEWGAGFYPGQEAGLSRRESQTLGLIVRGLSNQEVAEALLLSINSVKTYVRSAYRKAGVTTRGQAVAWAIRQGFPTF